MQTQHNFKVQDAGIKDIGLLGMKNNNKDKRTLIKMRNFTIEFKTCVQTLRFYTIESNKMVLMNTVCHSRSPGDGSPVLSRSLSQVHRYLQTSEC